jgi:hypothetical protein
MTDQAAARGRAPKHKRTPVGIADPVYQRLTVIKNKQRGQRQREVTYSEIIEQLLDQAEAREGGGQ